MNDDGLCAECLNEVGASEVDGTDERLGYGCLARILAFFATDAMSVDELARRIFGEPG